MTSPFFVCYASNFQHCNVQIHKTLSFDPDFLLVLNKWQCKDKILETRRLIILVVILLTMRVPSLWLYVFFSTHKMCWWLVISVSQFLQDLSKYRDALHGRKVFFMIQVSSPAFTLTQFSPDQSWYPSVHSFCTITLDCLTLFYF